MNLENFKDALEQEALKAGELKMTRQEAMGKGLCIVCGEPARPKCYSTAGLGEYGISGTCEKCFDAMFEDEYEEEADVHTLTQLQYAETGDGPWALYIYGADGFHSGKKWFRKGPMKYLDEEITSTEAKERAEKAISEQREVRICDGGDNLVFHSTDGVIHYPDSAEEFWKGVMPDAATEKL
jgi:hypothetical protein